MQIKIIADLEFFHYFPMLTLFKTPDILKTNFCKELKSPGSYFKWVEDSRTSSIM